MKFSSSFLIIVLLSTLTACTTTNIKKEAFAKPRTFAIATISGATHDMYLNDQEDRKIISDTSSVCFAELSKSKYVRLAPAKAAISAKAYASIKDDGAPALQVLATGYKGIDPAAEKKNLKALANELRVDGFIHASLVYNASSSGISINGLSIGSKKPQYTVLIRAYTPEGEDIWSDYVNGIGEEGITTVMGIGAYSALVPKLSEVTKKACQDIVTNLAKNISGN